jgi:2-aminoadipate transaminase
MALQPEALKSDMAKYGPPFFFPEAPDLSAYNFDQGLAAPETFPREDLLRLGRQVLEKDAACLDYFMPAVGYVEITYGNQSLRHQLATRIAQMQGRQLSDEGIILTSGSVQAIALTINGYVNRGDVVAVEAASFPYAVRYLHEAGADVRPVPIDGDGLDVEALEDLVKSLGREGKRLKMVYCGPTFHCPTGVVMSLERRHALVKLAQQHGIMVLEDDVYSDLRFKGEPLPSLLSLDDSGFVIQASTFSKMVAPGLRLGWAAGQPKVIQALASVRQDLGVSQWISRIMEEYLIEGLLEPHLVKVNAVYREKCDAALEGLREAGDLIRYRDPQGSFYLWIEIDDRVDWDRAQAEAAKHHIFFRPGERFLTGDDPRKFFRMAYSHAPLERVREGARKIAEIMRACARSEVPA